MPAPENRHFCAQNLIALILQGSSQVLAHFSVKSRCCFLVFSCSDFISDSSASEVEVAIAENDGLCKRYRFATRDVRLAEPGVRWTNDVQQIDGMIDVLMSFSFKHVSGVLRYSALQRLANMEIYARILREFRQSVWTDEETPASITRRLHESI